MSRVSRLFRAKLVLMILGQYSFGDHVRDDSAFHLRLKAIFRLDDPLVITDTD